MRELLQARAADEPILVIAGRLGLTRERVRQIQGQGIGRLRRALREAA